MTDVVLQLPFPPVELSPNARKHRWDKASYTAAYREQCRVMALNMRRTYERQGVTFPLSRPVTALITFVLTTRRRRDFLNMYAAFKAGEDGVVDAGVLADDDCWGYTPTLAVAEGTDQVVLLTLTGGPR